MKTSKNELTLKKLYEMYTKKTLNFNLAIQRKDGIWKSENQSLLIDSIVNEAPVPSLTALKEGRIYKFLDGKQRLTTIFNYIDGKFIIDNNIKSLGKINITGLSFNKLDDSLKDKILNYKLTIIQVENANDKEINNLFIRLNSGVAFKPIELTRAILKNKTINFIQKLAHTPFFEEKINITASARKRYVDEEIIIHSLMLISNNNIGFTSKKVSEFATKVLADANLRTNLQSRMENACYFLNNAFQKKQKYLNKVNLPIIFKLAYDINANKWDITSEDFAAWCTTFFSNIPENYELACKGGNKKENVDLRVEIIGNHFKNYFSEKVKDQTIEEEYLLA